jgi:5-formaminoimidazole-4-carboxamide-1-beta-D-ribofuranosyl 5'-monophosphate synthetase
MEQKIMKVFVYFNLHKKLFSIKAMEGENKGKVIGHSPVVLLDDVTFKVSEAGRQRVIRERKKNVHAGVMGHLNAQGIRLVIATRDLTTKVTYNPYKYQTFVEVETSEPVLTANNALLVNKRIYI